MGRLGRGYVDTTAMTARLCLNRYIICVSKTLFIVARESMSTFIHGWSYGVNTDWCDTEPWNHRGFKCVVVLRVGDQSCVTWHPLTA